MRNSRGVAYRGFITYLKWFGEPILSVVRHAKHSIQQLLLN